MCSTTLNMRTTGAPKRAAAARSSFSDVGLSSLRSWTHAAQLDAAATREREEWNGEIRT